MDGTTGRRRHGRLWGMVALAALLTGLPGTAQAARALSMSLTYDGQCVVGGAPRDARVTIAWRDGDGELKLRESARAFHGSWDICGNDPLERGDTVQVTAGTTSRTLTVPRLDLDIDRVSDVVAGKTAPDTIVVLTVCSSAGFVADDCVDAEETSAGDGTFDHDFSGELNLRGGGTVAASLHPNTRDTIDRSQAIPFVRVRRGASLVSGAFRPDRALTVELRDSGLVLKADWQGRTGGNIFVSRASRPADCCGVAEPAGESFAGRFTDTEGDRVRVQTDDRIVAPKIGSDADWSVPAVGAVVDTSTDVVDGTCAPNRAYTLEAEARHDYGFIRGTADGGGTFSRDMTAKVDLKPGTHIFIECKLVTGDIVARRFIVP